MNYDELYVAVPKAITNIYWNGIPKKSEPLGSFIVEPTFQEKGYGKGSINGFKEKITGERVFWRVYSAFDGSKYVDDIDCKINGEAKVGDIAWEIVDKSVAERLLSAEQLKEYMDLSANEVQDKLQSMREQAKKVGQEYESSESEDKAPKL